MMDSSALQSQAGLATEVARSHSNLMSPGGMTFRTLEQAQNAAEDFEAFFLSQMLQPMFNGLSSDPPFGGGHAEKIWRSLLVDEYGKTIAASGRTGIADAVMRTILAQQEV